ncbi:MAG: DeoR family transcriptional regulator [Synergistaceae bacterium]|nr:DeoR family transcriptional regulator [Synergistaceae bacterium]
MSDKKISKTERILAIFHLLTHCREVSYKEVIDLISVSKKTVCRDISVLIRAGWDIEFSKKDRAYGTSGIKTPPKFTRRRNERLYLQKIARLTTLMRDMGSGEDDPVAWYRAKYPDLSERTRQRDFKILNSVGYHILRENDPENQEGRPLGKYYCEWLYCPPGAYGLDVFRGK